MASGVSDGSGKSLTHWLRENGFDDDAVARLPLAGGLEAVSTALGEVLAAAFGEAPGPANPR